MTHLKTLIEVFVWTGVLGGGNTPEDGKEVLEVDGLLLHVGFGGLLLFFLGAAQQHADLGVSWVEAEATGQWGALNPLDNTLAGAVKELESVLELWILQSKSAGQH